MIDLYRLSIYIIEINFISEQWNSPLNNMVCEEISDEYIGWASE